MTVLWRTLPRKSLKLKTTFCRGPVTNLLSTRRHKYRYFWFQKGDDCVSIKSNQIAKYVDNKQQKPVFCL